MKHSSNADIRSAVERNAKLYKALRRSDIAMQFRQFMVSKGIRNVDLAERLGVSEANVSRWLKGNQNLSLDTLYQLADALQEDLTLHVGALGGAASAAATAAAAYQPGEGQWAIADAPVGGNVIQMEPYRSALQHRRRGAPFAPARSQMNGGMDDCAEAAA